MHLCGKFLSFVIFIYIYEWTNTKKGREKKIQRREKTIFFLLVNSKKKSGWKERVSRLREQKFPESSLYVEKKNTIFYVPIEWRKIEREKYENKKNVYQRDEFSSAPNNYYE